MPMPTFQDSLRQRLLDFTPHIAACGMQIERLDATATELRLPFREEWIGDAERGFLHPGIITTLIDSACGAAVLARIGQAEMIATLDLRVDFMRAAVRDADTLCRAHCHRLTAHIAFARATVWQAPEGEPIASAHGVFVRTQRSTREPA